MELKLTIVGTRLESDAAGLPARLEGVVFFREGSAAGAVAGSYEEELQPVLDPERGFVGTKGNAVFRLWRHDAGGVQSALCRGQIRSRIVGGGEDAQPGLLRVESEGELHGGAGEDGPRLGSLRSASSVRLAPELEMETALDLRIDPASAARLWTATSAAAAAKALAGLTARLESMS